MYVQPHSNTCACKCASQGAWYLPGGVNHHMPAPSTSTHVQYGSNNMHCRLCADNMLVDARCRSTQVNLHVLLVHMFLVDLQPIMQARQESQQGALSTCIGGALSM